MVHHDQSPAQKMALSTCDLKMRGVVTVPSLAGVPSIQEGLRGEVFNVTVAELQVPATAMTALVCLHRIG